MKKILCRSWSSLRVALALSVLTLAGCADDEARFEAAVAQCRSVGQEPVLQAMYHGNRLHVVGCKVAERP